MTTHPNVLAAEIEKLEQRVMTAASLEAARHFHDRLDAARLRYAAMSGRSLLKACRFG